MRTSQPPAAEQPTRIPGVRAAGVVLFLSFMDVTTLVTIVSSHAAALGAGPIGIGLSVGAYSATNLPANVIGGVLLDRVGRRRLAVLGFLLAAVAVLGYASASTVLAFIGIRALHGMAGGVLVTAVFAAAGDRTRAGRAGRSFGRFGAIIGSAWIVGPALAGVLTARSGTGLAFQVVAVLLVLGAIVTMLFLPDVEVDPTSDPTAGADAVDDDGGSRLDAMRSLSRRPEVRRALIATAAWMAAVGTLAAFLREAVLAVGAAESTASGLFSAYALMAALLMLSPLAARVDRSGADGMIGIGLTTIAIALLAMAGADGLAPEGTGLLLLLLASAVFGAGYGIVFPAVTGAISLAATTRTRGRAFGLFNVAFSFGLALGPPAVGALVAAADRLAGVALDPFVPAATLCLGTAVWIMDSSRRGRRGVDVGH
jgi:DHA1 family multidrug resistance protein-like MFS transporter